MRSLAEAAAGNCLLLDLLCCILMICTVEDSNIQRLLVTSDQSIYLLLKHYWLAYMSIIVPNTPQHLSPFAYKTEKGNPPESYAIVAS